MNPDLKTFFALNRFRQTSLAAALAFLAAFCLYTHTLSPAFHPDDSPETITAGATLSHQHPPGYPLHSLLGRISVLSSPGGPAFSVNLVAAFFGALAIALACLCLFEIFWDLAPWQSQCPPLSAAALGMSLALACTQTLWFQATIAKGGVYTLNLALTFATLYCVLKVRAAGLECPLEQLRAEGSFAGSGLSCGCPAPQALRLAGLFFGLGLANHWTSQVVLLPGYAVLLAEPRLRRRGWPRLLNLLRIAAWPSLLSLLGLSLYLYLPLRHQAPLVWGDSNSLRGLWWVFSRSQYSTIESGKSLAVFGHLMAYIGQRLAGDYTVAGVGMLATGWALLLRRRPFLGAGLLTLPLTLAVAVAWKANPPADSYFIVDPYLIPVHLGLGLGLAGWGTLLPLRRWLGGIFLAGALGLGFAQHSSCDHAHDFLGYDYVRNLLLSTPKDAVLFCEGDSNTAGPFFERFVQRHRADVTIITAVLMDYEWNQQALRRQDPGLQQPPQRMGPAADMAWIRTHNPARPIVWTNSYTKAWVDESHLLPRGLVLVWQDKPQAPWASSLLLAHRLWPAYSLRGVFKPYQQNQDPITVRLVQENYIATGANLAQALQTAGSASLAAEEYRRLGRLKPAWAPAWIQAGNADYQVKDMAAAGRDWQRAVDEDPQSAEALANLGLYYYAIHDFDQSLSYANKALALNPSLANAQQLRGLAMAQVAGHSTPAPPVNAAAGPGMQAAMRGDQLALANQPAEALAAYDQALSQGFANAGVYRNRGVMLLRLSRTAEAVGALQKAVSLEPKNAELHRYFGIMLYNSGDRPHGAEEIKRSAALDPKDPNTQNLLKQMNGQP